MHIYSSQKKKIPEVPAASGIGGWVKIERCIDTPRATFRVTYENVVGGTVAYRFAAKNWAMHYISLICSIKNVQFIA